MAKINIIILDDSRVEKCYAGCGVNWSRTEEIELAREQVKRLLRDNFVLEYKDLAQPDAALRFTAVVDKAKKAELLYPLLVINGDIRIAGNFDLRMLTDMLEASQELGIA